MSYRALLDMAVHAGVIMLESGAEMYRIEDTVSRMLRMSGLANIEVFALGTGIFATISDPGMDALTVIQRVRRHSTNLRRIYQVNNVSREFCGGQLTVEEAAARLDEIEKSAEYGFAQKCAGYVMVSGFFAVLFEGGARDCMAAAFVGLILALVLRVAERIRFNDFFQNAAGAFALAVTALFLRNGFLPDMNLDAVIISAIMPLVPGVTFTSGIRDTLNGDYSSGVARIAEAVVVALSVASGVGAGMLLFGLAGGVV